MKPIFSRRVRCSSYPTEQLHYDIFRIF